MIKRLFDLMVACLGYLLLFPLILLIACLIKWEDWGPIFFWQIRMGKSMRPFWMVKFRTMLVNAEENGREVTISGDPRLTRIGSVLRRLKLDEIPQLWNVLRGDMSVVGPRPMISAWVEHYTDDEKQIFRWKPGITDPATVAYRAEEQMLAQYPDPVAVYVRDLLPRKIHMSMTYCEKATLWTDIQVVVKTLYCLFIRKV